MTDDPRLIVAQEWLTQPDGRHLETAHAFLAELDAVDPLRQAPAEKPDFPPFTWEMARLLEFVAVVMPRRDWTLAELKEYRAAVFAAFPETTEKPPTR